MSDRHIYILNVLAILGTGMVAGVFLAFSTFIMAALGRVSPANGISAMQMINITVVTPIFMAVLFGSAIICLAFAYVSFRSGLSGPSSIIMGGSLLYLCGVIGVTMFANVPLNDALRGIDPQSAASSEFWQSYQQKWTFWNHIRCLAAIASCAAFIRAISMA
jgi:uncharacterized membrane protein